MKYKFNPFTGKFDMVNDLSPYLKIADAETTYLKLDCSNDPLTENLSIQKDTGETSLTVESLDPVYKTAQVILKNSNGEWQIQNTGDALAFYNVELGENVFAFDSASQLAYFNAAMEVAGDLFAGSNSLYVDSVNQRVGVLQNNPTTTFHVGAQTSTDYARFDWAVDLNQVAKPPTVSMTAALAGLGAGNVNVGDHYYNVTYYTALGETQLHNRSSGVKATTTAGNGKVQLSNIPVSSDPRVVGRRIYRTKAGESYAAAWLLVDIANNVDTTYLDDIADANLGTTSKYYQDNTTHKYITIQGSPVLWVGALNTVFGIGNYPSLFAGTNLGAENCLIGASCGAALTSGPKNVAIGHTTLSRCMTGDSNMAIGHSAGHGIVSGGSDIAIGRNTLGLVEGSANTVVGAYSAYGTTWNTSNYNSYYGYGVGFKINGTAYNCAFGFQSIYTATTGAANSAFGSQALYSLTTGHGNIGIGSCVDVPSPTGNGQLNIGCLIFGTGAYYDNAAPLAQSSTPSATGRIGIGTNAPQSILDVQGEAGAAGIFTLATKELTVVDGDQLGRINFNAPLESDGGDAILAGAAIWAEAEGTFDATNNATAIVFGSATTSAALERMRLNSAGNLVIGSPFLADDGDATHDSRMWFDKSKSAFSAGLADSTQWDDGNVGAYSVRLGGPNNQVSGESSFAVGAYNYVAGANAFAGGAYNTAGGYAATVFGLGNSAAGMFAFAKGLDSLANYYGESAQASGYFAAGGDAQMSHATWRIATTDATANTEMFLDGAGGVFRLGVPSDSTYAFVIYLVARRSDADNESAAFKFEGCIDNNAGTTALVGTVTATTLADDSSGAWTAQVTADNTNDSLKIDVTGAAGKTIRWVASGWITKVAG